MSQQERKLVGKKALLAGTILGGATTLLGTACKDEEVRVETFQPTQTAETKPTPTIKEFLTSKTEEQLKLSVDNYLSINDNFKTIFAQRLSIRGELVGGLDTATIEEVNRKAYEHVIGGLYLTQLLLPPNETIQFDEKGGVLTVNSIELNLTDPLQFQIAASAIEIKLRVYNMDCDRTHCEQTPEELKDEITDLRWLAEKNPNVSIEPGSFAILPKDQLVIMSRLLQNFEEVDIPFPREIRFRVYEPGDPGAGWYDDHAHPTNHFRITVTNRSDEFTLPHELGHFVSDAWYMQETNPQLGSFSQAAFEQMVEEIKKKFNTDDQITKEASLVEEYAQAFSRYSMNGQALRRSIAYEEPQSVRREVQVREYEFFRSLFREKEFVSNGISITRESNSQVERGDIIGIFDPDIEKPGIFLRPIPTLDIDSTYPIVWDGDTVQILEGPVTIIDQNGEKVEMYKVREGYFYYSDRRFFPNSYEPVEGWIPRKWFGEKILTDQ